MLTRMRMVDWLIVALIACAAVLPFLVISAGAHSRQTIQVVAAVLGVIGCVVMLSWMWFADGAHSKVWSWLPPFWPWSEVFTGVASRWAFVVLLVLGTVFGIVSTLF